MEWNKEIELIRAIDCHSHHLENSIYKDITLGELFRRSYLNWSGAILEENDTSRREWLKRVRSKNTFRLLERSLRELYGWPEITVENWEECSKDLKKRHEDPNWQRKILTDSCRYDRILLDAYWNSGDNLGDPDLFATAFRVDPMFFGYAPEKLDHDGNSAWKNYGIRADSMFDYLRQVGELIENHVKKGAVSLKNAIAYDRTVCYRKVSEEEAKRVFETKEPTKKEEIDFQDYFFEWVCDLAAQLHVPIQCHTGMGSLTDTRAIGMEKLIRRHPDTKFSIMHGSFPWTSDLLALMTSFENVWSDICWLPLLSPTLTERFLHELIEVANNDRVIWGCDTWTSEDSYAARLGVNQVLEHVLSKKVKAGYFSAADAMDYIQGILNRNAKELFFSQK